MVDSPNDSEVRPDPVAELVTGAADFAARATQMISGARTEVCLLSQELDRRIYGTEIFGDSLRRFVMQHQNTRVRILVNRTRAAMGNSPRLIEMGRALSSFVEFRELLPARAMVTREEILVTDGRILLHRESPTDLEARYWGTAPHLARLKLRDFDAWWTESTTAQELRQQRL